MNTVIITKDKSVEYLHFEDEDVVDILKDYVKSDPILESNLRYLTETTSNLIEYMIGLSASGYNAYFVPNIEVDSISKYIVLREGIAIQDGKPVRGHYIVLGELDDNSTYEDYCNCLQKINPEVNINHYIHRLKDWELIDFTVVSLIPEVKALMDITNTKVVINND